MSIVFDNEEYPAKHGPDIVGVYCERFGVKPTSHIEQIIHEGDMTGLVSFVVHHTEEKYTIYGAPSLLSKRSICWSCIDKSYYEIGSNKFEMISDLECGQIKEGEAKYLYACMKIISLVTTKLYRNEVVSEDELWMRNVLMLNLMDSHPEITYFAVRILEETTLLFVHRKPMRGPGSHH